VEHRVRTADGSPRWIVSEGRVVERDAAWAIGAEQHPDPKKRNEDRKPRTGRTERRRDTRGENGSNDENQQPLIHPALSSLTGVWLSLGRAEERSTYRQLALI
jgi:hypothetical protein